MTATLVHPDDAVEEPWPEIDAEAFHGLAGQIVDAINPITEADPVAVLAQFLAAFGCAFDRNAYCRVGDTRHHPTVYEVICGTTSKGRKGTSYDPVESLLRRADEQWVDNCVKSGLSSGEGIIHAVHDDIYERLKVTQGRNKPPTYMDVLKHPSVADKRLFIVEQEFASALAVMKRQGNNLSPVLRLGWDGRKLQTLVKHNAETATGAHLGIVGHITVDELRRELDQVHLANGFANRFCFVLARRSKELPLPGRLDEAVADRLAGKLRDILTSRILRREITFSPAADELWRAEYHDLSAEKGGMFGFLVARAEAQVLRLSMVYALLDQTYYIEPAHLRAALAFWRYCEASAKYVFGDMLGDPVADAILDALRRYGPEGMTRTNISSIFGRNKSSDQISQALALLLQYGKARLSRKGAAAGHGATAEIWVAT
jgi:hypothetical protein